MRRMKSLDPEEAVALEVMRALAQRQLVRGAPSEADQAALELRSEGSFWATPEEIENRIEENRETKRRQAEAEAQGEAPELPAPEAQEAVTPAPKPKRGRGRPPKEPPWLAWTIDLVAQGLTLRRALRRLDISLSEPELKGVYRLKLYRKRLAACKEAV